VLSSDDETTTQKAFNKAARWIFANKKTEILPEDINNKHVQPLMDETYALLHEGMKKGIAHYVPASVQMYLSDNVFVFSGAKTYAQLKELSGLLLDENGSIKPFNKFWQETQTLNSTYNKSYLESEYLFATQSAQMASKWQEYETDGDRYNLQYRTAGDDRVRESHWLLHNTTLPPTDKFWDEYFPPNGWRCRCTAVQVRKSKYPESNSQHAIQAGQEATEGKSNIFRFNPGKQQVIYPKNHPYFKGLTPTQESELKKAVEAKYSEKTAKVLRNWAKDNLQGTSFVPNNFENTIEFTTKGIKEFLNQPHKFYFEKNELIKDIRNVINNSEYKGVTSDLKNRISHIFEIEIKGEKSWVIVREDSNRFTLYSISDNKKVLVGIKE
jgi:SPP1 gp7 family putative phage head morphogenesis protein